MAALSRSIEDDIVAIHAPQVYMGVVMRRPPRARPPSPHGLVSSADSRRNYIAVDPRRWPVVKVFSFIRILSLDFLLRESHTSACSTPMRCHGKQGVFDCIYTGCSRCSSRDVAFDGRFPRNQEGLLCFFEMFIFRF